MTRPPPAHFFACIALLLSAAPCVRHTQAQAQAQSLAQALPSAASLQHAAAGAAAAGAGADGTGAVDVDRGDVCSPHLGLRAGLDADALQCARPVRPCADLNNFNLGAFGAACRAPLEVWEKQGRPPRQSTALKFGRAGELPVSAPQQAALLRNATVALVGDSLTDQLLAGWRCLLASAGAQYEPVAESAAEAAAPSKGGRGRVGALRLRVPATDTRVVFVLMHQYDKAKLARLLDDEARLDAVVFNLGLWYSDIEPWRNDMVAAVSGYVTGETLVAARWPVVGTWAPGAIGCKAPPIHLPTHPSTRRQSADSPHPLAHAGK